MTFEEILKKGIEQRRIPAVTQRARLWYRSVARSTASPIVPLNEKSRIRDKVEVGSMYMYQYDPKTKDKLPYYDRFPVIFVVGPAEGGHYGLNLHYLHPRLRAMLMDALYKYSTDKKYDANTKLNLTYQLLKSVSKLKYYEPCLKRYLTSHVQSNFLYVNPYEWDIAMMLPTQKFEKKTAEQVWEESNKKLKKRPIHR